MIDSFAFYQSQIVAPQGMAPAATSLPMNLSLAWKLDEISAITQQCKNILVYFWNPSLELQTMIDANNFQDLPKHQEIYSIANAKTYFATKHSPLLDRLYEEMSPLLQKFLEVGRNSQYQITLGCPQDRMCPLFHVDHISLRLIVTLKGPGTEWLNDRDVIRKNLGKGSNKNIVRDDAIVHELKSYQVGILKGEEYPGNFGKGVVHRSPAVPPDQEGRWFLRVDGRQRRRS